MLSNRPRLSRLHFPIGHLLLGERTSDRFARSVVAMAVVASLIGPSIGSADTATTRLLVKFKTTVPAQARANALGAARATAVGSVRDLGVDVVAVPVARADEALNALERNPAVQFAETDEVLQPQDVMPNDPSFPSTVAVAGGAWGWSMTHTTQAWDVTEGDPSTVIAILDTGLKSGGLSDFDGQISSTYNAMTGRSDVTTNAGSHGTYVAGIAGLAAGNGTGNAGYCPGCRLMIVQVGTDSGANLSDIASGLTWAADHGARVANMSWAGTSDSATLRSATTYAHDHGVVMTAAAGNSNCNCVTYPSADPYVLGVAGVSDSGAKAGDSNFGSWVKLAAPEGNLTAWPTINGSPGYAPVGGTSSAAPVVAGIAGLLLSANASFTSAQVEQALESAAAPAGFSVQYGRVDALAALATLGITDPQATSAPSNSAPPQLLVETNGDYAYQALTSSPQVGQVLLRGQGAWKGSAPLSLASVHWQRCDPTSMTCAVVGSAARYTVQSADEGYSLRAVISVKNGVGTVSVATAFSAPVGGAGSVLPVSPPVNISQPAISGTAQTGQMLTASHGSWSGSPTSYGYQWQDCDTSGTNCVNVAGATTVAYTAQVSDVGHTLRVSVTAANSGGSTTATSAVTAVVAAAPAPPPPAPTTQTTTFSGSLNPQNPARTFAITVGAGAAHAALAFSRCSKLSLGLSNGASSNGPSVLALDATLSAGTYTYSVSGGKCSFALTVTAPTP
jgi:thermitase